MNGRYGPYGITAIEYEAIEASLEPKPKFDWDAFSAITGGVIDLTTGIATTALQFQDLQFQRDMAVAQAESQAQAAQAQELELAALSAQASREAKQARKRLAAEQAALMEVEAMAAAAAQTPFTGLSGYTAPSSTSYAIPAAILVVGLMGLGFFYVWKKG
jgi:hypothetical protein